MSSKAAFKEGDRVSFKDGRHDRVAVVVSQEPANDTHPEGWTLRYKMKETGQNRLVRIAATDVRAAGEDAFTFKVGDQVTVTDASGEQGVSGKVFESRGVGGDRLEPEYAVLFKDDNGQTALAWWSESALAAAS